MVITVILTLSKYGCVNCLRDLFVIMTLHTFANDTISIKLLSTVDNNICGRALTMKILIFAVFVLFSSVSAIEEDDDCSMLDIDTGLAQPINGRNLNYCRVNELQCCTNGYFVNRGQAIERMITDDIQMEIEKQIDRLSDIVDGVENEIKKTFIPRFSQFFCGLVNESTCDKIIEGPLSRLTRNLLIEDNDDNDNDEDDDDDPDDNDTDDDERESTRDDEDSNDEVRRTSEQFASTVVTDYINATVFGVLEYFVKPRFAALSGADEACIRNAFQTQNAIFEDILRNLTQIRLATSALSRLRSHVKSSVLSQIRSVRPAKSCIQSFINVRCDACVMNITGTCRGACNALVFGCLAPFAEGLRDEFNLLWNSTSQIVNITNKALRQAGSLPQSLFAVNISNGQDLTQFLNGRCSLSLSVGSRRKRSEEDDESDLTDTDESESTKDDDSESTKDDEDSETTRSGGDDDDYGKEYELSDSVAQNSSRLLNSGAFNGENDVPQICSAYENTDCWNGSATVPVNNVEFDSKTVSGQQGNPLLVYNETELEVISRSFNSVITEYLESDSFQSVIPEGLVLENITTSVTDGSTTMMAGYTALLVAAVLCVLLLS